MDTFFSLWEEIKRLTGAKSSGTLFGHGDFVAAVVLHMDVCKITKSPLKHFFQVLLDANGVVQPSQSVLSCDLRDFGKSLYLK